MKKLQYILLLAMLTIGLPAMAKPAIIDREPEVAKITEDETPYQWRGDDYNESGTYYDTLRVADDNIPDTAFTLVLKVKKYLQQPQQAVKLYTRMSTYTWRKKTWPVVIGAVYTDTARAIDWLVPDTVYSLKMEQRPYFEMATKEAAICQTKLPYQWRGKKLGETDLYRDTVKGEKFEDLDTIYSLDLYVGVPLEQVVSFKLCPGESVKYRDRTYNHECIDTIRLTSLSGCDSLYIVHVKVGATYLYTEKQTICEGSAYKWTKKSTGQDSILTKQGLYYDSLKNADGCDSIICLQLIVTHPYLYEDSIAVCPEELPYSFGTYKLTKSGVYCDTFARGMNLCDSIVCLKFTVLKDIHEEVHITFCSENGTRHKNHGPLFYKDTVCIDTFRAVSGCRRIVKTIYQAGYRYYEEEDKHRSKDSVNFVWRGQVYTKDGTYTQQKPGIIGCDSTWVLHLMTDYYIEQDSTFCEGNTVIYRGKEITETCIVTDTLKTHFGGDSIIQMTFNVRPVFHQIEKTNMCTNMPIPWPGHEHIMLVGEGVYFDPYQSIYGCDSIYEIQVSAEDPIIYDTMVVRCRYDEHNRDSLPYIWFDRFGTRYELLQDTDVIDTLGTVTEFGCYNINMFHFRVIEEWAFDTLYICPGGEVVDSFGIRYDSVGDYQHRLTKTSESTYLDYARYVHIKEYPIHYNNVWDSVTICQDKTPYAWHNRKCMVSGEYQDTIPDIHGCDSIVYLRLTVNPTYLITINDSICHGQTYTYKGKTYSNTSVIYDTLRTSQCNCDSVYRIILYEHPAPLYDQDTVYFPVGGSYTWRNHYGKDTVLTKEGLYVDSNLTVHGCDSIYRLFLIQDSTYAFYETRTICQNETPFVWFDHRIYDSGDYTKTFKTKRSGLDSVYHLSITVHNTVMVEHTRNLCPTDTFILGNQQLRIYKTGTYYDTLMTSHGCDSIVKWNINVQPAYFFPETRHKGLQEKILWHGQDCSNPGVYYDYQKTTIYECDSVYKLTVIGDSSYFKSDTTVICDNQIFYWHDQKCDHSGTYTWRGHTIVGLDSVEELVVYVNPVHRDTTSHNLCQGEEFVIGNKKITQYGIYNDTVGSTAEGCNDIRTHIVNFYPKYYMYEVKTATDTVHWRGQIIEQPGTYYDKLTTALCHCDSVFVLTFSHAQLYRDTSYVTVCENELPYRWTGHSDLEINQSGTYADVHTSVSGADSSYYLCLTVAQSYLITNNATLCPGGSLKFFERTITQPGTYRDTLLTMHGCDSIFVLNVNMSETRHSEQHINLCYGETFSIGDTVFTKSGKYDFYTTTMDGCDSVVHYTIHIEPRKYFFPETKSINPGQVYTWRGRDLTQAGIYLDSLTTETGCDSVYKLTLIINKTYIFRDSASTCKNDPYEWRGHSYNQTGVYYDSLKTALLGLDSVYCLKLTVYDALISHREVYSCYGDTVHLYGQHFTQSTMYYDTLYSQYGCPQVTYCAINFYPNSNSSLSRTLNPGDTIHFFDSIITTPGVYTHVGKTIHACDSIVTLNVTTCVPRTPTQVHLQFCAGDSIVLGDTVIKHEGTYRRTFLSRYGCDSIVEYIVNKNAAYFFPTYATFCKNESYTWSHNGQVYTNPGKYDDANTTSQGCDSTYSLFLTALPIYTYDTTIFRCKDEIPYTFRGVQYWEPQVFRDTFNTIDGCDSIYITRFEINNHCSDFDLYTRCEGDELIVDGRYIINDGEYRIQIGADSIHCFNVMSYKTYNYVMNLGTHCDSVVYRGEVYRALGTGQDTIQRERLMKTVHGCDSIEHVTMILHKSAPTLEHTQIIYDYSSVLFGGQLYNKTADITKEYHTIHGCDSTVILHLQVIPTDSTGSLHYHYCNLESANLEIFGKLYHPTKDTIIFDTTTIPDVGMKIIKKAIVRVTYPFTVTSVEAASEVCSTQDIYFNIALGLNGSTPARYELDFLPSQLAVSPSHQEGSTEGKSTIGVQISGRGLFVSPGVYPYRLKLFAEDCHMSDTIIDSSITVHYPASIMEANWNNTIALLNKDYNAGNWQLLPPYNWKVTNAAGQDKTASINPNQSLSYLCSNLLESGDIVTVSPLRLGYDVPVSSCEFTFFPQASDMQVPILVYPTAARTASRVTIESTVDGDWSLYNSTGNKLTSGSFKNGIQTIPMPGVEGCYMLYMQPKDSGKQVKQLIVY